MNKKEKEVKEMLVWYSVAFSTFSKKKKHTSLKKGTLEVYALTRVKKLFVGIETRKKFTCADGLDFDYNKL